MSLWLRRSHKDHSYWDVASANFKHAIGLSCELVVEHIQSFIHSGICGARAAHTESLFSRQHCCLTVSSKDQCVIFVMEIIKIELHGHCQPSNRSLSERKAVPMCPLENYQAILKIHVWIKGGTSTKEPAYLMQETWDTGLTPGSGRCPGGGHGNPLQHSCPSFSDRGAV